MTKELNIAWGGKVRSRVVGGDCLADVTALLADEEEIFVIYDEAVAWAVPELGLEHVRGCIGLETSEEDKSVETALSLVRQLLAVDASRKALLIALGGGITSDITGFVASIYKRGIRYANIPTTLLSQVDAGIGGKTGVNLDGYKNMVGAFRMPVFTFLCPEVLNTLPSRELRGGLAEMLKTFLIADGEAYAGAVRFFAGAQMDKEGARNDSFTFADWVFRAAEIKAEVVSRDPFEEGERVQLNLGHTFGHAIEHQALADGDDISHGEAVAIGTIMAAQLAEAIGLAEKGLAARLKADFACLNLPTECPYPLEALQDAMEKDKKARADGTVQFVLPLRPGEVCAKALRPEEILRLCSE